MKRYFLIVAIFFSFLPLSFAQTARYTRQMAHVRPQDIVQLIANIATHHHLLIVRYRQKPLLYVYDRLLNLNVIRELPLYITDDCDVQILPFERYYFLIVHQPARREYEWWKIDESGIAQNVSAPFIQLIRTQFSDTSASVHFSVYQQQLYLMTNVFYPQIKKIATTLVRVNDALNVVQKQQIFFPFSKETENIHQMFLADQNNVVLLKTRINDSSDHLLELVKINLANKEIVTSQYNIQSYLFTQPRFFYSPADSSFHVYSLITTPFSAYHQQTSVLLSRLDFSLNQLLPATLMKVKAPFSFILLPDSLPWLDISWSYRYNFNNNRNNNWLRQNTYDDLSDFGGNLFYNRQYSSGITYLNNEKYNTTRQIKFLLLNKELKVVKDSTIKNDKRNITLHPEGYGKFSSNNTSYLLLKQDFPSKGTGLVLFYKNKNNQLVTQQVHVYDRYDYQLTQVQAMPDNTIAMPYLYKQEAGIVLLKEYE